MKEVNWHLRVGCGRAYLEAYQSSLTADWFELHDKHSRNSLSLEESFALIHPVHYPTSVNPEAVIGPRQFQKDAAYAHLGCGSDSVWGYACPLDVHYEGASADHLFPYSLGGPTDSRNKIYLCSLHNRFKGNDIHLFAWENGPPSWLQDVLDKLFTLKRRYQA